MRKKYDIVDMMTKEEYQKLVLDILKPLKPFYSRERARLNIGSTGAYYDKDAIEMEAFSRPLWALVPFFAGGGYDEDFYKIYTKGIVAGTTPYGREYWGDCESYDQRFVEMAAIALGLIKAPELLWDPLSDEEKDNLCNYLSQINRYEIPACNWLMFAVLVNVALKKLGRRYDGERMEWYLDEIDSYYVGDGWFQDGNPGNRDYYVSFGIHFYCLLYATLMRAEDPNRSQMYINRAEIFGKDFINWFDEDGAAIPYGRSQTYRFAQVSFFSACIVAGARPFSIGVMKGLINRHLCDWLNRPIFDNKGILTIGYGYPNLLMSDKYNAPGSPYWSMKAFIFLMLDDEHPFWKAKPEKYPIKPGKYYVKGAQMIYVQSGKHVAAYVPGTIKGVWHGQAPAKYSKFVYDSRFSISCQRSNLDLSEMAADNMLVFEVDGMYYERRDVISYTVLEDKIISLWSPFRGITVETTIIPSVKGHKRIHRIESEIDCVAYEMGSAIDAGKVTGFTYEKSEDMAVVVNTRAKSAVKMEQSDYEGRSEIVYAAPNTHYLYPKTAIPGIRYEIKKGTGQINSLILTTMQ